MVAKESLQYSSRIFNLKIIPKKRILSWLKILIGAQ